MFLDLHAVPMIRGVEGNSKGVMVFGLTYSPHLELQVMLQLDQFSASLHGMSYSKELFPLNSNKCLSLKVH